MRVQDTQDGIRLLMPILVKVDDPRPSLARHRCISLNFEDTFCSIRFKRIGAISYALKANLHNIKITLSTNYHYMIHHIQKICTCKN